MSLDIYLRSGTQHKCPECDGTGMIDNANLYDANITHNLTRMAEAAGIYDYLWHPEKVGITKAGQLIRPLGDAIGVMGREPERFKKFDDPNGWGTYNDFLPWLVNLLAACVKHPEAEINVSI